MGIDDADFSPAAAAILPRHHTFAMPRVFCRAIATCRHFLLPPALRFRRY